jgi:uncharacterized membrane protein
MERLALVAAWIVVIFIGLVGGILVVRIYNNQIKLFTLLEDADGKASFSRFQFLIFTFVIAMCLLILTIESGEFPKLDMNVLGLLGISGGSYVVSKGITANAEAPPANAPAGGGGGGAGGRP